MNSEIWVALGVLTAILIPIVGYINRINNRSVLNKTSTENNANEIKRIQIDFKDHEKLNERSISKMESENKEDFKRVYDKLDQIYNLLIYKHKNEQGK